jgi:hypothetical protein
MSQQRRDIRFVPIKRNQVEHDHQCSFFSWLRLNENKFPELKRFFAIPNGGHREQGAAVKFYLEGVRRGVLDTCLPLPRHGKAGLWIEFKAGSNNLTPDQVEWKAALELEGHEVHVVREWIEAAEITAAYLKLRGIQIPAGHMDQRRKAVFDA